MAPLSEAARLQVWRGLMRLYSRRGSVLTGMLKADLRAAVDATDDWIDSNAASYNSAIPQPARSGMTAEDKTLLFVAVALVRADPELARAALGDLD